jgi:hypothetical protein
MADFNLDKGHFITAHRKNLRFSMKMMFAAGPNALAAAFLSCPIKKTGAERQSQVHIYGNDYQPF